jgi:hypothetical protein
MGFGGGKLKTGPREGRRRSDLARSTRLTRQSLQIEGGSQERAGGAYKQMASVHFGCAGDGVRARTAKRPLGGAAAGQGAARVISDDNAYHCSAAGRGLVLFPRFGSLRRMAAEGGRRRRSASRCPSPHCEFRVGHSPKKRTPKSRLFSTVQS